MAFWWVNQGQSYRWEREGGYMWAPLLSTAGHPTSHWETMTAVRPGDLVFHYARGIRAVGTVAAASVPSPMPPELPNVWDREGRLVRVDYTDVAIPVALGEIPIERRIAERGPFASIGKVNLGYLYPLSSEFGEWLLETFADRFGNVSNGGSESDGGGVLPQDPALRKAIEIYAVDVIVAELEAAYGVGTVRRMPPNNKGFDIEVSRPGLAPLHIEAKGTQRMAPLFLMSESERLHSKEYAAAYELWVVWGIDLDQGRHAGLATRAGEVAAESHRLVVQRWQGRLAPS